MLIMYINHYADFFILKSCIILVYMMSSSWDTHTLFDVWMAFLDGFFLAYASIPMEGEYGFQLLLQVGLIFVIQLGADYELCPCLFM